MSAEQKNTSSSFSRFASCWRMLCVGCGHTYRHVNLITHHVVGFVLKTLLVLYFLFCALFLTLRYGILPNIDHYKNNVEQLASKALGNPITIGAIAASWHGLQPSLSLTDVVLHDKQNQAALRLPQVTATVSWRSVLMGTVHLASLEIDKPDLQIARDTQGNIFVAGVWVNNPHDKQGSGADWVFSQRQIVIRHGTVRWNDKMRNAPELTLSDVNLALSNGWRSHQFALHATPPTVSLETPAAPVELQGQFVHPLFAKKIADITRWKGTLYADVRNTDLTNWKPYFDYPLDIKQGAGSVRTWLDVNATKISKVTADVQLSNLSIRMRHDLASLELTQVSGRISASENLESLLQKAVEEHNVKRIFDAYGHNVALTNFSLETSDGLKLPRTTLKATYLPAQGKQVEKFTVSATQFDLQTIAAFAQRLPLTAPQLQLLTNLAPRGQLTDFSAEWQGAYPAIVAYHVQGKFQGFGLNAQAPNAVLAATSAPTSTALGIPGVQNLSGDIDASEKGGSLNLDAVKTTLALPGLFAQPAMPFTSLKMQARWEFLAATGKQDLSLKIESMAFVQDGLIGALSGNLVLPLKDGHVVAPGVIDMTGKLIEFDAKKLAKYLPLHTPEHLRSWLVGAIQDGKARDVAIKVKGDLVHFPFNTGVGNTNKPTGEFSVKGKIDNGKLEYVPGHFGQDGKQPLWPILEKINGTFVLDRHHLQIKADSASTAFVALSNVVATVPDLFTHDDILIIEGNAAGSLQNFVNFTNSSPVEHWIGGFTHESEGKGNAKLKLNLEIPLTRAHDTKVNGILTFANNDVVLQKIIPPIQNTNGALMFNEKGFALNAMTGTFLGGPVQAAGGTQADGTSQIKISGNASIAGLRGNYPNASMQSLLSRASGSTPYSATVSIHDHHTELRVDSTMQGLALNFPAPLRKAANDNMPFKFEWIAASTMPSNGVPTAAQGAAASAPLNDVIKLSLGTTIMAQYQRQKSAEKNAEWRVLRGGIGINVAAPEPESGLSLHLQAKSLNVDEWHKLANLVNESAGNKTPSVNTSEGAEITQYITPNAVGVHVTELTLLDKKLNNVVVGATYQNNVWQANIDATQASGFITWSDARASSSSNSGRGLGKVTARLSSLHIPESATADVKDLLDSKDAATQIPSLDIVAEDFQLKDKKLGRLELAANNVRVLVGSEWQINKLWITNPEAEFKATGKWTTVNDHNLTNLTYVLEVVDGGKLLDRFGFAHVLKGTKGHMDGEITWQGLPFSFDIPSLSGKVNLDMKNGQFLKVDSGAAKLLGVLSLQSLPRRLTLDFRDVFSDGFAFDSVVGSADITQGKIHTDNFKMGSVSATVLMDGGMDIAKETQDLHVIVLPEVNAGAASLVALAINPVVGISTFLAQLFLREPLRKAFTFEYHITGPWKDPAVKKVDSKAADAISAGKKEFEMGGR